jgi:uracil-DNA glycosylase
MSGSEEFRWHFGPMFYRGRLRDNSVKVVVIGQEGAQDESLSHRSFTGGTGARMQHFLHHVGITESYLFLNTFVYPIFGQYNGLLPRLAQDSRSPIAAHRGRVLDYMLVRNDVRLVVAVGRAAKESVATWIESHGGQADPDRLHVADAQVLGANVRTIGVLHPGGASKGGAVTAIIADFKRAFGQVEQWENDSPGWLPVDPGGSRQPASTYAYKSAPIPFRDFPYGTCWRLGRGSTSSNRKDGQESIQLFGQGGKYGNTTVTYPARAASSVRDVGYAIEPGDLDYEPPKRAYHDFDPGPRASMARLLQGGSARLAWPDFAALGLTANPSFGLGPGYRGRLTRPSILVLADEQSCDDLFTGRALTGNVGQHLQALLRAAGVTKRYAIVRTLPVGSLADPAATVAAAVGHPATRAILREVMRRAKPAVVLALGRHAQRVAADDAPAGVPVVNLAAFSASNLTAKWQPALDSLNALNFPRDVAPGAFSGGREPIPRFDLPYGTLRWQATTGDRAQEGRLSGSPTPDYVKIRMPTWAGNTNPSPLSADEHAAVQAMKATP